MGRHPPVSLWPRQALCDLAPYAFRRLMRALYNDIKTRHGENAIIHVFPAIPVSCALEIGRVRSPKSDLPLVVYDNILGRGFVPRLEVK